MTTMVSRDDVADEIYKLIGQYRAPVVPKIMAIIDRYALAKAQTLRPAVDWGTDPYRHLKPGETDMASRKRRCLGCGNVKNLDADFARDNRMPQQRRRRCQSCSPGRTVKEYYCPACRERKPLKYFPEKKHLNVRFTYKCLTCM